MKKHICVVLAVLMAAALISGCMQSEVELFAIDATQFTETNGLALPLTDTPVRLSVMTASSVDNLNNKLFAQAIRAVTGVELDITVVADANYGQQLQMLTASRQLPDVFTYTLRRDVLESLVRNDVLVNFSEHADSLPNIRQVFLENPEAMRQVAQFVVDGDLFVIAGYQNARTINHGFMYRDDIFAMHDIESWTNTEEFYNALVMLKEIYPDSTPFVSNLGLGIINRIAPGWGFYAGWGISLDAETNQYVYAGTHPRFREMLDFLQHLYAEGLLDPEFLTASEASWSAKITQDNQAFVTFGWVDRMDMFTEQMVQSNPNFSLRFGFPIGPVGTYPRLSNVGGGSTLAVSNNARSDVAMRLVDFLLSPAGAQLSTLGVEGISYEMVGGEVRYIGLPETANIRNLEETFGLFTQSLALRFDPRSIFFQYTPRTAEAQEIVVANNLLTELAPRPVVITREGDAERFGALNSELSTAAEVFISRYIMGRNTDLDAMWAEWVETANSIGAQELVRIANNQ